jgi:hypothetical protein
MSTKTNFKRIALVAIAALGLGVLSSVPSQAAVTPITVAVEDGTSSFAVSDSTTAAVVTLTTLMETTDCVTVQITSKSSPAAAGNYVWTMTNLDSSTPQLTAATVETIVASTPTAAAPAQGTSLRVSGVPTAAYPVDTVLAANVIRLTAGGTRTVIHNIGVQLDSTVARVAGTYTATLVIKAFNVGSTLRPTTANATPDQTIIKDVSIVVTAAAATGTTPTATYSYVDISADTGAGNATGRTDTTDATITAVSTAGTASGSIFVGNRNSANGSTTAKESITVTLTGAGLICLGTLGSATAGTCGKSLKVAATGDTQFLLQADGNAGLSTIVVTSTVSGVTATKTLNYYSVAAKTLVASNLTPILAIGSNDSAVAVTATDTSGISWAGQAYIYASTAADATAVGGSATTPVACTMNSSKTTHYCPISAVAAGTGKFKVIDAATVALATATSNEVTVTSSAATAASLKIAFSKASYAPNEVGYFVVTGLDAAGKALPASTITNGFATGGITSASGLTMTTCTSLTSKDVTIAAYSGTTSVAGSQMCIFTAPSVGGVISLTAKGGTGLPLAGQVALSASATVTDNASAALAAVTALATTVASLKTLITTLTNLVLKIQKKVKA